MRSTIAADPPARSSMSNDASSLQNAVSHVAHSLRCDECKRLSRTWITAVDLFTEFVVQLKNESPKSMERCRQLRIQFENARLRARDSWLLLELHRRSNSCDRRRSAQHEMAALAGGISLSACKVSAKKASQRRECELLELAQEGVPVVFYSKWHASIGPLHIWPSSGRWSNSYDNARGKINSDSIRSIIWRELCQNPPSIPALQS